MYFFHYRNSQKKWIGNFQEQAYWLTCFFWPGSVLAAFHLSKTIPKYTDYGRPMKPFFIKSQTGQVFLTNLSAPILVLCPCFLFSTIISTKNQVFISKFQIFILFIWAAEDLGFSHHAPVCPCPNKYSTWVIYILHTYLTQIHIQLGYLHTTYLLSGFY